MPTVNTLVLAGSAVTLSVDAPITISANTLVLAGSAVSLSTTAPITIVASTLILAGSAETLAVDVPPIINVNTLTLAGSAVLLYALVNVFSPVEAALLREQQHQLLIWGNVLVPDTIWTARIDDVWATRSTTSIVFDTGSGTDYSLITASQEVWVGTSAGAKDVAKLRIRSIASGDGGVTGTLTVAHHPWILANNHYITFKFDYPIRQKFPLLGTDGTFYKDRDIVYADENAEPNPVCVCGTDRGGWLDPGSGDIDFEVDVSESYATAEGASITSYSMTVLPSAGSSTVFNTSTGVGTITFTTTGQRWVRFSAADSNGKSQFTFRCYWVNDPDPNGSDHPMFEFSAIRLNGDWERGGWNSFFQVQNDATLTDIPDAARILLWSETTYGTANRAITLLPENDVETIFNGYLIRDTTQQDLKTGAGLVNFEMHTPHEMLRRFNFTVSLEVVQGTPATWWQYEEWMTVGRAIHHLWKHHSTVFRCWDVLGLLDNSIPKAFTEFEDADLFSMADTFAFQRSIRAHIVCDVGGRFHLTQDLQLLTDGERGNKRTILDITMDDLSGQLELRREPINKVAFVKVSGFMWDGTTFITDERNEIVPEKLPICASAPGLVPAYEGEGIHVLDRQNFISQVHANEIAGRVYAQENNEYRSIPMSFHGNYHGVFDVAYDHFYTMSLQAGDTARGVVWTEKKLICRSVAVQFDTTKGSAMVNSTFEAVMDGIIGEPAYCMDDIPDYGGEIEEIEDDEAPDALVTGSEGSSVYFKTGYGQAWSQRSTQGVKDLIQDPFWPNKQSSTASDDAILFDCGVGFIRKSVDGGQNWEDVTPYSHPPNDAIDFPSPTVSGVTFSQLDGNWTYLDEFVAMVTWQNASGEWRTWLYYTDDDFATGTYKGITGGSATDLTSWNTPSTDVDGGPAGNGDWYYSYPGWSQRDSIRSFAKMSNTKYVAMYLVDRYDEVDYETGWGYCRVIDILPNGTLSVGAEYGPWSYPLGRSGNGNEVQDARIYFWDEDYFIIISSELDSEFWPTPLCPVDTAGYGLIARAGSVNGQVITFGSNYSILNQEPLYPSSCNDFLAGAISFAKLPGTDHGIILTSSMGAFGDDAGWAFIVQKSAISYSLTFSSIHTWEDSYTFPGDIGIDNFDIVAYDEETATIFFNSGYDDSPYGQWNLYAMHTTVDTALMSLTFDVRQRMDLAAEVRDLHATVLTNTRIILILVPQSALVMYSAMITKSGSTYSVLDTEDVAVDTVGDGSPYWNMQIEKISSTRWVVFWDNWTGTEEKIHARIGYMATGVLHQYGDVINFTELSPDPTKDRYLGYPTGFPTSEYLICFFGDDQTAGTGTFRNVRAITADLTLGFDTKGMGISIGKGDGNRVYVTVWDGSDIILLDYDLPTLSLYGYYYLGSATEAQIAAGTYYAYPFGGIGDDDWVVVYGRMNDPSGLGSPTYVIESEDGGPTAELVQVDNTWTTGGCTALWMEPNGFMYAVRNLGTSAKLYYGNAIVYLSLMSTLTFPAGVNPHGLKLDPYTLAIYAAADTAQSVMIVKSHPFYTSWTDMTYDHGTSSGVNSLELL